MTFYDEWLDNWRRAEEERSASRKSIHEEELEWVETAQDARAALLVAPETGFRTWGSETMIAEIPVGSSTGEHSHGEEAMYIVEGEGFSVVDGVRYNWDTGSALVLPFGSRHQHFNTGDVPARYFSALSVHLEHWCGLNKFEQYKQHGPIGTIPRLPVAEDGYAEDGTRIRMLASEAVPRMGGEGQSSADETLDALPSFDPDHPLVVGDIDGMDKIISIHKSQIMQFMRINTNVNDFKVHEMEISGILTDPPQQYGGTHAHMEAHLYILDGEGYTLVDGERVDWRKGTGLHIPGPQTVHQHVNQSDVPTKMLRIAPGLRYYFENAGRRTFPYLYLSPRQELAERVASRGLAR